MVVRVNRNWTPKLEPLRGLRKHRPEEPFLPDSVNLEINYFKSEVNLLKIKIYANRIFINP